MMGVPAEGSYLWVNKNLITLFVLVAFAFISSDYLFGLDRLFARWKEEKARQPIPDLPAGTKTGIKRRDAIRDLISVPVIGAFAYALYRKRTSGRVLRKDYLRLRGSMPIPVKHY